MLDKTVAIFGSTGSIGRQSIEVARKHKIKIYFKKWNTEVKFQISLMNYYNRT